MENASKALLMAAGVLIGVLIISLAVYLFIDFGTTSAEVNQQNVNQQLVQFNSKFTSYEGREDLSIYDVITVGGYAQENNKYYGDDDKDKFYVDNYKIEVILKSRTGTTLSQYVNKYTSEDYNKLIHDEQVNNPNGLPSYKCEIKTYHENGRVKTIIFTKK